MSLVIDKMSFGYRRSGMIFAGFDATIATGRTLLLGRNGAGKSTLLALVADGLRPSTGTIRIAGVGAAGDRRNRWIYRRSVGWLPQTVPVFPGLSVRESVAYSGWLKGLRRRDAWDASLGALRAVDLVHRADQRAATLSGGQRKRLGIAGTLVSRPSWLLLDEPMAGLDPEQRVRVAAALRALPDEASVIVSTHQTEDVAADFESAKVLSGGTLHDIDARVSQQALMDQYSALVGDDR
jgi:ABC-2 type transport system ATP-binding protein